MDKEYPQAVDDSQEPQRAISLSPADIGEGFARSRVSAALKHCARNAGHVGNWQEEQADALGYPADTFKHWYYGRRAPEADDLVRLIAHYRTGFLSAYLAPLGLIAVNARDTQTLNIVEINRWLRTAPQQLEGLAADMRELKERVVPVGKCS